MTVDGGKTWKDVTPPVLKPWAKVSMMDAAHSDPLGAYAAINTIRLDDLRPHIYRTHDGGKSWTEITSGLPDGATINTVKEDPKRKGLLFAGSETQVYVSFDDGEKWQSLRLNMADARGTRWLRGVPRAASRGPVAGGSRGASRVVLAAEVRAFAALNTPPSTGRITSCGAPLSSSVSLLRPCGETLPGHPAGPHP